MKRAFLLLLCGLFLAACSTGKSTDTAVEGGHTTVQVVPSGTSEATTSVVPAGDFDWSGVPVSNKSIGNFPYLKMPPELVVLNVTNDAPAKGGLTESQSAGKFLMYDGNRFWSVMGRVGKMHYGMANKHSEWWQAGFDKTVAEQLQRMGAKQLFAGQLPRAQTDSLMKAEGPALAGYLLGDDYFETPVRHYALHHASGKIFFQVHSNDAWGEVWVIEERAK